MTNFKALALATLTAITLVAAPAAKAEDPIVFDVPTDLFDISTDTYNTASVDYALINQRDPNDTCPAGKQRRVHTAANGTKTDLGCVTDAEATLWFEQYKAALAGQRRPSVVNIGGGYGGPKTCNVTAGLYRNWSTCY